MAAEISTVASIDATPRLAQCYHCGLPVPRGLRLSVTIDDIAQPMCCAGCAAVAQTIVDNNLTSYYRQRSALPLRDDNVPAAVREIAAYEIPEVENECSSAIGDDMREAALMLEGITCAACVWLIEQRIARLDGVRAVEMNYTTQRARVRWDARRVRLASILSAITALGYRAHPYDSARAEDVRRRERGQALWRLFVAGFGMMQVMMYLVPVYVTNGEMTADIEQVMRVASLVLTVPVVLYAASPFFLGAWRDLRNLRPGMDVPVALGIAAAFAASVAATVAGSGPVYFDSVAMFVFLLLAARYLEMTVRQRALSSQERLARPAPTVSERFSAWPDSATTMVAAGQLNPGDYVRIRAGVAVPADGIVVDGESDVDECLLSGESRPQPKRAGDALVGSTLNLGSALVMRVTRVGNDTVLAGILRLLERATSVRPRLSRSADTVARYFVVALLLLAAAVAAFWYQVDPSQALWITVAVLVVSCPCALSLATPAAVAAATGALHGRGVLVTRADAIENLARATDFVFDKTGTLTSGNMRLTAVIPLAEAESRAEECIALAAAMEAGANHPVARALVAAAPAGVSPRFALEPRAVAGGGIEAIRDGKRIRLGNTQFVSALGHPPPLTEMAKIAADATLVALADESGWIALFTFTDPLREHARHVVAELTMLGKAVHLLSGDRPQIVAHVARQLGIAAHTGGSTPEGKLDYVRELQRRGAVVAMIGDGVNDTASLAAADVAIAMGAGAEVARCNSDIILLCNRLDALLTAVRTTRATLRIVHQNLAWAFAYNIAAIPLAASGMVSPLIAGAGMAFSSALVVANALRLLRNRQPRAAIRTTQLAPAA